MDYEKRVQAAIREIVQKGLAESAHDLSDGGLAVALAESCTGGTGAEIDIAWDIRPELALFHEGPSRILVSTSRPEDVKKIALFHGVESPRIGTTAAGRLTIRHNGQVAVDLDVKELYEVWDRGLERLLHHV
jgi:phosphoribosylformylglycinamidine synthase